MFQQAAQVISNHQVADGVFAVRLFADKIAAAAKPGQFIEVRCGSDRDFILRRPFAVHAVSGQAIEILFDVKGKGTRALARSQPHDVFDVIGPLGRGFSLPSDVKRAVLVSGGMGIASLMMLADELGSMHVRIYFALGAKTKSQLLNIVEIKRLAREVVVATDDGSYGERGAITELVPALVHQAKPDIIYGCGPRPMLSQLARVTRPYEVPCEVSLEALMACGVGACLSCAIRTQSGVARVCAEGPVFAAEEVVWEW